MGKIALLAIFVLALIIWFRYESTRRNSGGSKAGKADADRQQLVRCADCGAYVPLSESIQGPSGQRYCEPSHQVRAGDVRR